MAADGVSQLLAKFTLDTSEFKKAVSDAKTILTDLAEQEKVQVEASKKATAGAVAAVKQQISLQKQLQAEAATVVVQEKAKTAEIATQRKAQELAAQQAKQAGEIAIAAKRLEEQASRAVAATNKVISDQKLIQSRLDIDAARKVTIAAQQNAAAQLQAERLAILEKQKKLKIIQEEMALERKRHLTELKDRAEESEGRGSGGLLGKLFGGKVEGEKLNATAHGISGIFGAGLGSTAAGLATGALVGGIGVVAIESITESIAGLIEKFKELTIESGKLTQLSDTFQRLAHSKGIEDTSVYLEELRGKTRNLVTDIDLLKTANTFLQSSMNISREDMLKLTGATIDLARANGHDAVEAIHALQRFFLTGRAYSLSMVTGIQRQVLAVRGLGTALTETQRMQANFNQASKVIEQRAGSVGAPATTFQESIKGFENVRGRLVEAFGQGVTKSTGLQEFIRVLTDSSMQLGTLEEKFKAFGNIVGNALGKVSLLVASFARLVGPTFKSIGEAISAVADWDSKILVTAFSSIDAAASLMSGHLTNTKTEVDALSEAFSSAHPILDIFGKTAVLVSGILRTLANTTGFVAAALTKIWELPTDQHSWTELIKTWSSKQQEIADSTTAEGKNFEQQGGLLDARQGLQEQVSNLQKLVDQNEALHKEKKKSDQEYLQDKEAFNAKAKDLGQRLYNIEVDGINLRFKAITEAAAGVKALQEKHKGSKVDSGFIGGDSPAALGYKIGSLVGIDSNRNLLKPAPIGNAGALVRASNGMMVKPQDLQAYEEALIQAGSKKNVLSAAGDIVGGNEEADTRNQRKLDLLKIQEKKSALGELLAADKEYLSDLKERYEDGYKTGLIEQKQYYADRKAVIDAEHNLVISNANKQYDLSVLGIQQKVGRADYTPEQAAVDRKKAEDERKKAIDNADKAHNTQLYGLRKEQGGESSRIASTQIDAETKQIQANLKIQEQDTEEAYKERLLSGSDYVTQRIAQIDQEVEAVRAGEQKKLEEQKSNSTFTLESLEQSKSKIEGAIESAQEKLSGLKNNFLDKETASVKQNFSNVSEALQSRLAIAQTGGNGESAAGSTTDLSRRILEANQEQIRGLENLLQLAQPYSDTWYKIYLDILKATQAQSQLTLQMQQMSSLAIPIGNLFTEIGHQTQGIFGSRFAKGLEAAFSGVGEQLQHAQEWKAQMSGGNAPVDPNLKRIFDAADSASKSVQEAANKSSQGLDTYEQSLETELTRLKSALADLSNYIAGITGRRSTQTATGPNLDNFSFQPAGLQSLNNLPSTKILGSSSSSSGISGLFSSLGKAVSSLIDPSKGFPAFAKQITGFVSSFGSFMNTITQSGSATAGAFAGTVGGASLGGAAGGALEKAPGLFGMSTAMAGPIGEAAGAVMGLVTGLISGQKQEQVKDMINQMDITFKAIMESYQTNNQNLASTVKSIQGLIQEAQQEMASSKKDSSQFADLIKQYNEQITQLEDQAKQTMTDLQTQLDSLAAPTAYQSVISQVAQIVQQYEKFAAAAQSATDLAKANQFLVTSLEQFAVTSTDTLRQNEQDQIQNALQLNDLYNQRNQLNYSYLQQVMQIQGQGTLTRTQTRAQSGYAQMYWASHDHAVQLDALNQQINIAQYQVTAAQKIFNLATSRAGLEAQLFTLQKVGIDQDMARIAAMQNLLKVLSSSGYSLTTGSGNNPNQQTLQILQLLLQLLGLGNVATSAASGSTSSATSSEIQQLYSLLSQLGIGSLVGQGL